MQYLLVVEGLESVKQGGFIKVFFLRKVWGFCGLGFRVEGQTPIAAKTEFIPQALAEGSYILPVWN